MEWDPGFIPWGKDLLLPSAWTLASHDRERDIFRQSEKTTANFIASRSTPVTQIDAGDHLDPHAGEPAKQVPTWPASESPEEKEGKAPDTQMPREE